jgi:tetratricopeptide (TPR) repeat protein
MVWSVVEAQCDDPEEALRRARMAVAAFSALRDDPGLLAASGMLAWALQGMGRDEEAAAAYDQVLELGWRLNDQAQVQFALCNRAECRWRAGEPRPAEGELRSAIATFETARAGAPSSAEERAQYLEREVSAYDSLIGLLVETGRGKIGLAAGRSGR